MALWDEVVSRYPNDTLVSLTNPRDSGASSVDLTRANLAVTDVLADVEIYCGVEYDGTDARHVSVACQLVILKLMERTGQYKRGEIDEAVKERREALKKVTGNDRILPQSNSTLTPNVDPIVGAPIYPDFDISRFSEFIPGAPGAGTDNPYPLP